MRKQVITPRRKHPAGARVKRPLKRQLFTRAKKKPEAEEAEGDDTEEGDPPARSARHDINITLSRDDDDRARSPKAKDSGAVVAEFEEMTYEEVRAEEQERVQKIYEVAREFGCYEQAPFAIKANLTVEDFQTLAKDLRGERDKRGGTAPNDPCRGVDALASMDVTDARNRDQRTWGQYVVESDTFKNLKYKKGDALERGKCRIHVPSRAHLIRATLDSTGLTSITDLPGLVIPNRRELRLGDIIPGGTITAASLRYLQEAGYTNAATGVAEGAEKPEATLTLEQVTESVEKIAVWTKVTDEMLEDWPVVRSYIDNTLSYMVQEKEDIDILSGDGSGSNELAGILNVSTIQSVAASFGEIVHDAFNKAIENVRSIGRTEPNWFVINPLDWGNLERTKDGNGQYLGGGPWHMPYGAGPFTNLRTIWGIPALITQAIPQGTALCGNFSMGAQLFRRSGLTLEMSNSDDDNFTKNLVTVLAEQRAVLAVWKPLSFCEITGIQLPA